MMPGAADAMTETVPGLRDVLQPTSEQAAMRRVVHILGAVLAREA